MNTESNNHNDILSLDEAATLLKVSRRTVQSLIKKGQLRASKVSTRFVRLFRRDIDAFLESFATSQQQ
jgi:excisionase family DNA binding protein